MAGTESSVGVPAVRYGIIGSGMMGTEHIRNIAALDGASVVAISDPDPGSREQALVECPDGVDIFVDHGPLLTSGLVDAVVIASPNFTHLDVLSDVIESGIHVLVEKPLCTTVADCRTIIARAAGASQVIQVGLEYRYMPPVARLVQEVRKGVVGTVKMMSVREHRFPFLPKVGDWNRFREHTGGTLVEKCCHFFDLMNLVLEERPVRVMASGAQDVNHLDEVYAGRRSDMLDNAYVIVDYPSGARACLDLCMFAEATHNQEEISAVGDRGKIEALIPEGVLRTGRRGEHGIGDVEVEEVSVDHVVVAGHHHGSSYFEHVEFVAAIRNGGPAPVTLDDGLWSVAVGEAAHRSIDERRSVLLEEVMA